MFLSFFLFYSLFLYHFFQFSNNFSPFLYIRSLLLLFFPRRLSRWSQAISFRGGLFVKVRWRLASILRRSCDYRRAEQKASLRCHLTSIIHRPMYKPSLWRDAEIGRSKQASGMSRYLITVSSFVCVLLLPSHAFPPSSLFLLFPLLTIFLSL